MIRLSLFLLLAGWLVLPASPQVASDANSRYQTPEQRAEVAANLVRSNRDETQKPEELIAHMELTPGMTVADVGTGAGYMLPFLSRAVGPAGHVLAQDIFDDFLAKARQKAANDGLPNVAFVKGTPKDPGLPATSVDVILALDSYHHYDYPHEMVQGMHKALKPGGRLVIVEYYRRPGAMRGGNAMQHIRVDEAELVREVESNGFRLVSRREQIPDSQYMAIFRK